MIWHWRFDNFDWQLDPLFNVAYLYPQYWTAAYTGALFLHSQRAMKWTGWMFVWCFSVYIYFLDPSISFMVHVSFTLNDIMTIMSLQRPTSEISLQHHLVAYRISYVINFIFNSRKCVLSYLLFIIFPILSEPNL